MSPIKRYQVYLDSRSVGVLDEVSELLPITRSWVIREAVDQVAGRMGSMLAKVKPVNSSDYLWLDKMVGSLDSKKKFKLSASERVDDIYYDK
ncbi:MAG: hypothetical protein G01um101416_997 [Microgenomates group bacterium Gr01-1014_16]|nr:MAG: hypothetical protein G01um101416_997 [Microgenomates group bacterium Gr01-1014_16]